MAEWHTCEEDACKPTHPSLPAVIAAPHSPYAHANPQCLAMAADARSNILMSTLPEAESRRLQLVMQPVDLRSSQVLSEPGTATAFAIFPLTAIVSLLYMTRDGASTEVAVIGRDGMVGLGSLMGGNATPSRAVVQTGGKALRVPLQWMEDEMERSGALLEMVLRYAQALMTQVAQTAVCNRFHSIDQQLSRRLLTGHDLSPGDELVLTHEAAASLLGVRREGVTSAAQKLRLSGAIRYRRGHVAVLERTRLEAGSCECYAVTKKAYRALLRVRLSLAA